MTLRLPISGTVNADALETAIKTQIAAAIAALPAAQPAPDYTEAIAAVHDRLDSIDGNLAALTALVEQGAQPRPDPGPTPDPVPTPVPDPNPTPTPTPDPAPTPAPTGSPATGLLDYGKALRPFSPLAKPAKGQRVADPDFPGAQIVRITDVAADFGGSKVAIPVYPTIQAWNCDESLLILYITEPGNTGYSGHALFDGRSYALIKRLDINPADVEQIYWHPTQPDLLRFVDNRDSGGTYVRNLVQLNVRTGEQTTLKSFTGNASLAPTGGKIGGGGDPFGSSADGDLFGLGVYQQKNGPGGAALQRQFAYRLSTDAVQVFGTHEGNVAQALPSGRGLALADSNKITVLDGAGNAVRTLPLGGEDHADMLRNAAGDDVWICAQFDGPSGSGALYAGNLTTGQVKPLIAESLGDGYPPSGTLVSGRAVKAPGWCAVAMIGCPAGSNGNCNGSAPKPAAAPATYLDQEVLLANVDTGQVLRVAHHRSTGNYSNAPQSNYWAQPNVTLSPSGTRILVQSDWGAGNPSAPVINPNAAVDTYVIELPGYVA